jgi:hypothetical protein
MEHTPEHEPDQPPADERPPEEKTLLGDPDEVDRSVEDRLDEQLEREREG